MVSRPSNSTSDSEIIEIHVSKFLFNAINKCIVMAVSNRKKIIKSLRKKITIKQQKIIIILKTLKNVNIDHK